jgi:hypothetical protein
VTPGEFLESLYSHFDDGYLTLFSIDRSANRGRHTNWFDVNDIAGITAAADGMPDRDVWFGLATRSQPLPYGARGGDTDCVAIPAMWLDIDIAGPNHQDQYKLPIDIDQAYKIIDTFPLPPSIVIDSGGGLHVYWQFDEPIAADDARVILARWAATWAKAADSVDMRVDNVFDLARVLRMPGTYNHKPDCGSVVSIVASEGHRYSYSDIHDATIEPPVPPKRATRGIPMVGMDRPGDDFNARHGGGHVLGLAGWSHAATERNGNERWLHPWSPSSDCSATVYADDGHTTVWSETAAAKLSALDAQRPYDPFGLYVAMMHDGDFRAAATELSRQGYGKASPPPMTVDDADAPGDEPDGAPSKPMIVTTGRHLNDLADEVVETLVRLNDPPSTFRHGDTVSTFARGELEPVDRVRLMNQIEMTTKPVALKKDSVVPSRVDATALDITLLRLLDRLPAVEGLLHAPFMRPDGTVCVDVGYDERSRVYLTSTMPIDVPTHPTPDDVARAVSLIDEFIADFPLATQPDRAHVFGLLLTLMTRHLMPLSPLIAIDGNGPGVGKNLLSECCVYIATGEWVQTDPLPLDSEEQRKQITSLLATGRSVALFDEAHIIGGTSLARLITSTTWGDRLLGYSKQVSYPNRMTVVALGNNVEVTGDMPRRTVLIRLSSGLDRPELRTGFRHDDLRLWVTNNRARMIEALLTILRAWHAAGQPRSMARLGSFDAWATMIGGALETAGVVGFLANAQEMRERSATDDSDMEAHLEEIVEVLGEGEFGVRRVAELIESGALETIPPKVSPGGARVNQQLGHVYRRYSGRWLGGYRLTQGGVLHKSRRWSIEIRPEPVDKGGGLGGLGGLAMPTHEVNSHYKWPDGEVPPPSVVDGAEVVERAGTSPPSPPSPPPLVPAIAATSDDDELTPDDMFPPLTHPEEPTQ